MRDRFELPNPFGFSGGLRLYKLIEKLGGVLHVELADVFQCEREKREKLRRAGAFNRELTGLNRAWCQKCQGLWYSGNGTAAARCPQGPLAVHVKTGSGNYVLNVS